MQETLETRRLVLSPFNQSFLSQSYVSWLNDPEVVKYSEQRHVKHNLQSCAEFVASCDGQHKMLWAIEETEHKLGHVGNIDATIDRINKVADISILLGQKDIWGKGIGLEAFTAVIEFLLHKQMVRKVTAGTMACNVGMRAIMKKALMKEEAIKFSHYLLDGKPVDLVYGARFREGE